LFPSGSLTDHAGAPGLILRRATERYPSSSKRDVHGIDIRHGEADVIDARRIAKQSLPGSPANVRLWHKAQSGHVARSVNGPQVKTSESVENEKLTWQEAETVSGMGTVPPNFGNASPQLPHNHPNFSRIDQSFLSNEVLYVQSHHRATVGERQMSHSSNVVNKRPMLRVAASVILVFCCAAPLVWLFSNPVAYGLRSFL
jgi:hypothetical protein